MDVAISAEALRAKLVEAFKETLPDEKVADWTTASQETVPAWDSFTTLTLLMVVEQNTGISIGLDKIPYIHTFTDVEKLVAAKAA
jgi:acyl carrier protein